MFIGLLTAFILKHTPGIREEPVKEITVIVVFGYLSYMVTEAMGFSGIIALFCSGFTMSHYAYYNISFSAQSGSSLAI